MDIMNPSLPLYTVMLLSLTLQAQTPNNTTPLPASANSATATRQNYTLQGVVSDANDHPFSGVRIEFPAAKFIGYQLENQLQTRGSVATSDANGRFTLTFSSDRPLVKDKNNHYAAIDFDKEGYLGQTIDISDLAFFKKSVAVKLQPNPITEERAEFTRRISLDHTFPVNSPELQKFSTTSPSLTADDWERFFSTMDHRTKSDITERVTFQAYIPKNATQLKAMFLFTRHGIGSVDHPKLRDFADRNGIALVGLGGNPVQRGFYPVSVIDDDIKNLGQLLHHPELSTVPIISFGHSNGTGFSGIFASQRPDRVIAWISYHSGVAFHLQFPGVEKVPGLALHGSIDPFLKNGQEQTLKNLRKNRNAAVALMMEGNVAHSPVEKDQNATWDFIVQFCEAAMRIRLNADGTLRPVVIEQGWLGANYDQSQGGRQDLAIAPYAEFQGDRSIANWLPDKTFAEIWQLYGKTAPQPTH